jgi:hypothetical protein
MTDMTTLIGSDMIGIDAIRLRAGATRSEGMATVIDMTEVIDDGVKPARLLG